VKKSTIFLGFGAILAEGSFFLRQEYTSWNIYLNITFFFGLILVFIGIILLALEIKNKNR